MREDPAVKIGTWCGHLRLCQRRDDRATTMDVRRVHSESDGEHVQIAITVEKIHPKRTTAQHGYLHLRPDDVPYLITALTNLRPKYDPAKAHLQYSESEAVDRAFYGLGKGGQ